MNTPQAKPCRGWVSYDGKGHFKTRRPYMSWLPLLAPTALILAMRNFIPPWIVCWGLAFTIYAGCKWLTWFDARQLAQGASLGRNLGYLLAWPGMDAKTFLDVSRRPAPPMIRDWISAVAKTALGLVMIFGIARRMSPENFLLAAWVVMIGLVFTLHFGLFHLLSLVWRQNNIDAAPLMRSPGLSTSLSDFWSVRWNSAFRDLAHAYLFRPLRRPLGLAGAMVVTFLVSGLVHDLVISFPARGGYGGPTAFFLIQAAGLLFERSATGRRMGLGRGASGWLFTLIITIGPAYWLFHPAFATRVIIPMANTLGAM